METTALDIFAALEKWIGQRSKLDWRDYYSDGRDIEGRKAAASDARQVANDGKRARAALAEARSLQPARLDVLLDSFRAFSGRLEWKDGRLDYTTGQYWPTEYRKAAASVLETYCAAWRAAENAENPKTFTYRTMADVIAANQSIGHHFFSRDTMRGFKSKIETNLLGGHRFVTSETNFDGTKRLYTIRAARPDGTIDTIGEFQGYATRRAALVDVLKKEVSKGE